MHLRMISAVFGGMSIGDDDEEDVINKCIRFFNESATGKRVFVARTTSR